MAGNGDGSSQQPEAAAGNPGRGTGFFGPWNDRFELGEALAKGSQGEVYVCTRRRTGITYAVKKIETGSLEHRRHSEKLRTDLRQEITIMRGLTHTKIVNLLEAFWEGAEGEVCFIVMDLVRGGSLEDHIVPSVGLGHEASSSHVAKQLVDGLGYMHANSVVHRDLKPANILVLKTSPGPEGADGEAYSLHDLKIADFGLSRCLRNMWGQPRDVGIVGTPAFSAPEVAKGSYDERADFWSLGCILYVTLCGEYPFSDEVRRLIAKGQKPEPHPCEAWSRVSSAAKAFVLGLLAVVPSERLNARGCLSHRWLAGSRSEQDPTSSPRSPIGAPRRAIGGRIQWKGQEVAQRDWQCWRGVLSLPRRLAGPRLPAQPSQTSSADASSKGVMRVVGGWTGAAVDSLEFRFRDGDKQFYGGQGGERQTQWSLSADELVLAVSQGIAASDGYLGNGLVFFTSLCRILTIQGQCASLKHRFVAPSGSEVVGLQFDGSRLIGVHLAASGVKGAVRRILGWEGYAVDNLVLELRGGLKRSYGNKGGNIAREWLLEDSERVVIVEQGPRDGYLGYSFAFYTNMGRVLQLRGLEASRSIRFMAPSGRQVCGLQFESGTLTHVRTCPHDGDRAKVATHEVLSGSSGPVHAASEASTSTAAAS